MGNNIQFFLYTYDVKKEIVYDVFYENKKIKDLKIFADLVEWKRKTTVDGKISPYYELPNSYLIKLSFNVENNSEFYKKIKNSQRRDLILEMYDDSPNDSIVLSGGRFEEEIDKGIIILHFLKMDIRV